VQDRVLTGTFVMREFFLNYGERLLETSESNIKSVMVTIMLKRIAQAP
jgi:hypothetical protein